jgi:hypothetical protein
MITGIVNVKGEAILRVVVSDSPTSRAEVRAQQLADRLRELGIDPDRL